MKVVKSNVFAVPVRVIKNTDRKDRPQWGQIINASTNQVLHTGQVKYIKRVAKTKYNVSADIQSHPHSTGKELKDSKARWQRTAIYSGNG